MIERSQNKKNQDQTERNIYSRLYLIKQIINMFLMYYLKGLSSLIISYDLIIFKIIKAYTNFSSLEIKIYPRFIFLNSM